MENKELIEKLLDDLKTYPNMMFDLYLQKCEALRTLYKREEDLSHALGINLEMRKRLNVALNSKASMPREQKQLLKKYWQTYLFAAPFCFHSFLLYMEKDREPEKRFYQPRLRVLRNVVSLKGIVAKKKDSKYYLDKRTKEWIKIKNLLDDDFVICGFIQKENNFTSVILGQYRNSELVYKGHVTLGVSNDALKEIEKLPRAAYTQFEEKKENENAVWVKPLLVCTVKYMMETKNKGLRQPVFKGLRDDKAPDECIEKQTAD